MGRGPGGVTPTGAGTSLRSRPQAPTPTPASPKDFWDLHEKIDEQLLRSHLARFTGGTWTQPDTLSFDGGQIKVGFAKPLDGEIRNRGWACLAVEYMGAEPMRQGHGTKFINALKDWSDYTGQRLLLTDVIPNERFWGRFDWLETAHTEADDQFTYHPNLLEAAWRRKRETPADS
jgi:hypothetical protein